MSVELIASCDTRAVPCVWEKITILFGEDCMVGGSIYYFYVVFGQWVVYHPSNHLAFFCVLYFHNLKWWLVNHQKGCQAIEIQSFIYSKPPHHHRNSSSKKHAPGDMSKVQSSWPHASLKCFSHKLINRWPNKERSRKTFFITKKATHRLLDGYL